MLQTFCVTCFCCHISWTSLWATRLWILCALFKGQDLLNFMQSLPYEWILSSPSRFLTLKMFSHNICAYSLQHKIPQSGIPGQQNMCILVNTSNSLSRNMITFHTLIHSIRRSVSDNLSSIGWYQSFLFLLAR